MPLTKPEWEKAMDMVQAALITEIPADGGWQVKPPLHYTKNTNSEEMPNNHPANADTSHDGDEPGGGTAGGGLTEEIPADGGFQVRGPLTYTENKVSQEMPDAHPAKASIAQRAAAISKAAVDFGVDTATAWQGVKTSGTGNKGKPDISGDTAKGWSKGKPLPRSKALGKSTAAAVPAKSSVSLEPGDPKGLAHSNPTPRSSMASASDPTTVGPWDSPQLPDGSFSLAQPGDVAAAVGKVQTAETTLPARAGHVHFQEVKNHIAKRANVLGVSHLVPPDWQLSMAMAASLEIARKFTDEERQALAKDGKAMPGGGYPIKDLEDLDNAIQAYGREPEGKRGALKSHLARQARALKAGKSVLARIAALASIDSK
jgi:hypothetical protein